MICPEDIALSFVRVFLIKIVILLGQGIQFGEGPPSVDGEHLFLLGDIALGKGTDLRVDGLVQDLVLGPGLFKHVSVSIACVADGLEEVFELTGEHLLE